MNLIFSILLGLLVAVIVHVVGTEITNFEHEGLIWGLIAILVFLVVAFGAPLRRGRAL